MTICVQGIFLLLATIATENTSLFCFVIVWALSVVFSSVMLVIFLFYCYLMQL